MTEEEKRKIITELSLKGLTADQIADQTPMISRRFVQRVRKELREQGVIPKINYKDVPSTDYEKLAMLREFFPVEYERKKPKREFGKVPVGYKSGFRTPYRPDGIWR